MNTYTVQTTASDPLRNWITTTTLHPSFTIENHGFYHPSYQMVAGMSLGDSLLMAELANPAVARELRPYAEHNVLNVWRSLSKTLLDSGDFVYPSGLDWALHGYGQVSYYAWLSAHFRDPLASWAEKELINLIRRRQEVMGDGSYFGDSVPNGFFREAVLVRRIAIASLHHQVALRQAPDPVPPRAAVAHWPDVKVALQRSERGFTALSYGERVMAQVVPSARGHEKQPYVVTPRFHGIFGSPDDNGEIEAKLRRLDSGEWGFSAEIEYVLEDGSETIAAFEARDGLVVILEVPVAGDPGSPVSAFPVGIENHALTGGSRAVASAKGSHVITAMSGVKAAGLGQWVNIDGRLGMIVGPGLDLHYRAADGLNRRGAAEDTLYAVSDEVGSARFVVFLPSADAKETVELSRSLEFTRDDTRVILRLTRQGHEAIVASLVVAADEPVIPHHDR